MSYPYLPPIPFIASPSEGLALASHCQHLRRWEIPRSSYPEGLSGYKSWRFQLNKFHTAESFKILQTCGYSEDQDVGIFKIIENLLQKKTLKGGNDASSDEEMQLFEGVQASLNEQSINTLIFLCSNVRCNLLDIPSIGICRIHGKTRRRENDFYRTKDVEENGSSRQRLCFKTPCSSAAPRSAKSPGQGFVTLNGLVTSIFTIGSTGSTNSIVRHPRIALS